MNIVFLQLGSNLGNRKRLFKYAISAIEDRVGSVVEKSRIYESTPWRVEGQEDYLNQIVKVRTKLIADDLLSTILDIEKKLGRIRVGKWGERLMILILFSLMMQLLKPHNCVSRL